MHLFIFENMVMKRLIFTVLLLVPIFSYAQYGYGEVAASFFYRLPSARAEAMGRSFTSIDGDLSSVFFSPAGIATIEGLEVNGSFASPISNFEKSNSNFSSIGYKFNDFIVVALSRKSDFVDLYSYKSNAFIEYGYAYSLNTNYTLTLSSQPLKNLFLGLNTNYFIIDKGFGKVPTVFLDFGVIKKFELAQRNRISHSFSIASSITNLNKTLSNDGTTSTNNTVVFPVINRYGANYQFSTLNKGFQIDTLKTFKCLIQSDYVNVLSKPRHSGFYTGSEFTFFEFVSLRMGYIFENRNGRAENNNMSDLTYGFGIELPIDKLTKIPLNIKFDYTSLPQAEYINNDLQNFTTYNLRLNWKFKS